MSLSLVIPLCTPTHLKSNQNSNTLSSEPKHTKLKMCVKIEVAVLGFPVPNIPYGLCGRKATVEVERVKQLRGCVKVEVDVLMVSQCGLKATLEEETSTPTSQVSPDRT